MRRSSLLLLLSLCAPIGPIAAVTPVAAQAQRPAAGVIELAVDARDIARKLLHAQMRIPASPGAFTLVYP